MNPSIANLQLEFADGLIQSREGIRVRCRHEFLSHQLIDSDHDRIVDVMICRLCDEEE